MPSPFPPEVADFLHPVRLLELFRALVIVVGGLLGARLVSATISRVLERRASAQHIMLIRRAISWLIVGLTVVTVLRQLGFDLGVLVGAAGVFTVALGFASQTSASNLISGLFLIGERPFVVGDIITVGTRTGEVTSIDLLSVKLRTFDNLFVRIPNETLLKTEIVNVSYYAIRRVDFTLGVARDADLDQVHAVLLRVAEANPVVLDEPGPLFAFDSYQPNTQSVIFGVWAHRDNFLEVKRTLPGAIHRAFIEAGIEMPLPETIVHTRVQS